MANTSNTFEVQVASLAEAFNVAADSAAAAWDAPIAAAEKMGLKPAHVKAGGKAAKPFVTGVLIAWQGPEFAAEFARVNGGIEIQGRVVKRGKAVTVTKDKAAWQRALSARVARIRDAWEAALNDDFAANGSGSKDAKGPLEAMLERITRDAERLESIVNGTAKGALAKVDGDVAPVAKGLRGVAAALRKAM